MGGGAELCNLNLLMKTLKRARIETSTEKSLVCVSVVNVHICWSLESCEVKNLISLIGLTILLGITQVDPWLSLFCYAQYNRYAKLWGLGLEAMTSGTTTVLTDTCIQSTFQKLWKQQILPSSSTLVAWVPLGLQPLPSEPRSF